VLDARSRLFRTFGIQTACSIDFAVPSYSLAAKWLALASSTSGKQTIQATVQAVRSVMRRLSPCAHLPVPVPVARGLAMLDYESLFTFLRRFNARVVSATRYSSLLRAKAAYSQSQSILRRPRPTAPFSVVSDAFTHRRSLNRTAKFRNRMSAAVGSLRAVSQAVRASRVLLPALLSQKAAQQASVAMPSQSSLYRYSNATDLHNTNEASRLFSGKLLVVQRDSGKFGHHSHNCEALITYLPDSNMLYRRTAAIRDISSSTGAEYHKSLLQTLHELGLSEKQVMWHVNDTAASIVGQKSANLAKSKGAVELARQQSGFVLQAYLGCVSHNIDGAGNKATTSMSGEDPVWYFSVVRLK
jgi:hypothetical protein